MARKKWIHSFSKYRRRLEFQICSSLPISVTISGALYTHPQKSKKQTEKQNEHIMKENKTVSLKDNEKIECTVGSKRDKPRGEGLIGNASH